MLNRMKRNFGGTIWFRKSLDKYLSASNGKVAYTGDRKGVSLDGGTVNVKAPKTEITRI